MENIVREVKKHLVALWKQKKKLPTLHTTTNLISLLETTLPLVLRVEVFVEQ